MAEAVRERPRGLGPASMKPKRLRTAKEQDRKEGIAGPSEYHWAADSFKCKSITSKSSRSYYNI